MSQTPRDISKSVSFRLEGSYADKTDAEVESIPLHDMMTSPGAVSALSPGGPTSPPIMGSDSEPAPALPPRRKPQVRKLFKTLKINK